MTSDKVDAATHRKESGAMSRVHAGRNHVVDQHIGEADQVQNQSQTRPDPNTPDEPNAHDMDRETNRWQRHGDSQKWRGAKASSSASKFQQVARESSNATQNSMLREESESVLAELKCEPGSHHKTIQSPNRRRVSSARSVEGVGRIRESDRWAEVGKKGNRHVRVQASHVVQITRPR